MMSAHRYTFEFISSYDGQADYRIWRDGRDHGRFCVKNRQCFYVDGSGAIRAELDAFNAFREAEHARALAKHGAEFVEPWTPYVSRPHNQEAAS